MPIKKPRETERITWTDHALFKMQFYGLSESRIRRVLKNSQRKEEGIIPGTVAVMQVASPTAKVKTEIWVMYAVLEKKADKLLKKKFAKEFVRSSRRIRIITCWRYPGTSPVRQLPPIPEDILREIHQLL
jgi:hypothetical protein